MSTTSNPKTVSPLTETFRLKTCIEDPSNANAECGRRNAEEFRIPPSTFRMASVAGHLVSIVLFHARFVQYHANQTRRVEGPERVFDRGLRRHAGADDEHRAV